jgi:hypothetical protein
MLPVHRFLVAVTWIVVIVMRRDLDRGTRCLHHLVLVEGVLPWIGRGL